MKRMKKILAYLVIVSMIVSLIPGGTLVTSVHAAAPTATVIYQRVQDTNGKNTQQYVIGYTSDNPINKPTIRIVDGNTGLGYLIDTAKYPEASLVSGSQIIIEQSIVHSVYNGNYDAIFNDGKKEITITNKKPDGSSDTPVDISIVTAAPPYIQYTNIVNKLMYVGQTLNITGSNYRVNGKPVGLVIVDGGRYTNATVDSKGENISLLIDKAGTKTGELRLYVDTTKSDGTTVLSNAIETVYQDSVYAVTKLSGIDIVNVQPNTGSVNGGTFVKLQNKTGLNGLNDKVKVYFPRIVNGVMEPLSDANLATGNSFDAATNTLTVRTKASTKGAGDARIVITSADGTSRYDDSSQPLIFSFVEADNALTISNITPNNAKASSQAQVAVVGKNIGTLNINGLNYAPGKDFKTSIVSVTNQQNSGITSIVVKLSGLKFQLASSSTVNVDVEKTINVLIGGSANAVLNGGTFGSISTFSTQQDQLYVTLPVVNIGTKPFETYDTVVSTETKIYNEGTTNLVIPSKIEEATLANSFTYNSDFIVPTLSSITPAYGPKDKLISVTIKGTNFYVMQQSTGRLYPKVVVGTSLVDPARKTLTNVRVYNSSTSKEVDGSPTNYIGDIIKGDIPADPVANINANASVYVSNPEEGAQAVVLSSAFKFMDPDSAQMPHIVSVVPNLVSTKGGEDIVVTGSNFKTNSELYINGEKVQGITVNGTGEQITFKTPPGRPGAVNLQVFNPSSGGMDSAMLEYTDIYTSPKITSVAPNKGGSKTLVTLSGSNFMGADVTAKPNELYKIVGSRVLFNNIDLNVYNKDTTGAITLADFNPSKTTAYPIIKNIDGIPTLDSRYTDIILANYDTSLDKTIDIMTIQTINGDVIIKDGYGNRFKAYIDTNNGNVMKLVDQNGITSSVPIAYNNSGNAMIMTFTIYGKAYTLLAQTPYKIGVSGTENVITGRYVKVVSDTIIELTVPPLVPSQGNNDVTVLNPDTAKFTLKNGFFYYSSQGSKPTITNLDPKEGSITGGTIIKITGTELKQGIEVYFGSQKSGKVITSADETTIYAELPAYSQTLPKGINSVDVPVVLVNPTDGGTCVWEERFTYRVPTSYPEIKSISPNKYNASGGVDVIILGKNFMQGEPYTDLDGSNGWNEGEPYIDLDHDGTYDVDCLDKDTQPGKILVVPELAPRVYFGGEVAKVKDFKANRLVVTLPKYNGSGAVDVVVVNPDTGTYVKKGGFTYEISSPRITAVVPAVGPKTGGTEVTVLGSGFIIFNPDVEGGSADDVEDNPGAIQVFVGDNNDIGQEVISGGSLIKKIVLGNMNINYDNGIAQVTLTYRVKDTSGTIRDITVTKSIAMPNEKVDYTFDYNTKSTIPAPFSPQDFINAGANAAELAKIVDADENVRLRIEDGVFYAMRRLGTVDKINSTNESLIFKTPPSTTIGVKDLIIFNNDGGTAKSKFEYGNPLSRPTIDQVTPNRKVDYESGGTTKYKYLVEVGKKGGDQIRIQGKDYRDGVSVYAGDQKAEVITITDLSGGKFELLVKLPAAKASNVEKELKITVVNTDTASAISTSYNGTTPSGWYPYWLVYKEESTAPTVKSVVPNKGPKIGGTSIKITGTNFGPDARVFIGGLQCSVTDVDPQGTWVTAKTAPMAAPILEVGTYDIQVKNYESGILSGTGTLEKAFTYISSPIITGLFETAGIDAEGNYNLGASTNTLRITGNETMILAVTDLLEAPTIVVGGKITLVTDFNKIPVGTRGMDANGRDVVVSGGKNATLIKIQNKIYAVITTPTGTVSSNNSIIVINKDGGVSNAFGAPYIKPVPLVPSKPMVQAVDGDTLKVEWLKMENVLYYELYLLEGTNTSAKYKYLGSIEPAEVNETTLRYYASGLKPSTSYRLKIRAVNLFGLSQYSTESDLVETKAAVKITYYKPPQDTYKGGVPQASQQAVKGSLMSYIVGERSFSDHPEGVSITMDPQNGALNMMKVDLSLPLLRSYSDRLIKVGDSKVQVTMTGNTLLTIDTQSITGERLSDAKMTVILSKSLGQLEDDIRISIPVGYKVIVAPFGLNVDLQVQKDVKHIKELNGSFDMSVQYDKSKQRLYRGGIYVAYYNTANGKVEVMNNTFVNEGSALAQVSKTGHYLLVGKLLQ